MFLRILALFSNEFYPKRDVVTHPPRAIERAKRVPEKPRRLVGRGSLLTDPGESMICGPKSGGRLQPNRIIAPPGCKGEHVSKIAANARNHIDVLHRIGRR